MTHKLAKKKKEKKEQMHFRLHCVDAQRPKQSVFSGYLNEEVFLLLWELSKK